jgi:muconolactone D-isomerase
VLFAVTMDVALPHELEGDARSELLAREKAYFQELQHAGEWVSIWRSVGQYANLSIFDVADNERLHEILWGLPLFPYMSIEVTPLATHPSSISAG